MKVLTLLTLDCMAMIAFGTALVIETQSEATACVVGLVMPCLAGFTIGILATWGKYIERKR